MKNWNSHFFGIILARKFLSSTLASCHRLPWLNFYVHSAHFMCFLFRQIGKLINRWINTESCVWFYGSAEMYSDVINLWHFHLIFSPPTIQSGSSTRISLFSTHQPFSSRHANFISLKIWHKFSIFEWILLIHVTRRKEMKRFFENFKDEGNSEK